MEANMDDSGKITIKPVGNVEVYALKEWRKNNESGDVTIETETEKPFAGFKSEKPK